MTIKRYTRTAMALHWIIAALILANIALGLSADHLPQGWVRPVLDLHKSFGITVLGLAAIRLLWRATHPAPPLPADYPGWERWSAHAVHVVLYFLIFSLPLSGWAHDSAWSAAASHPITLYGLIPWPHMSWFAGIDPDRRDAWHDLLGRLHESFGYVLYAMVGAHILGALKHQWLDREPELQRMLPGTEADEAGA